VGSVTNNATVASDTSDPDETNNSASATTTVNAVPSGGVGTGVVPTSGGSALVPVLGMLGLALLVGGGFVVRRRRSA